MNKGQLAAVVVVLVISATAAHAQRHLDFSLSGGGVFTSSTTSASGRITNTPTKSVAVLGGVRYHLTEHHAFDVTFGLTRNSQSFSVPPDTYRVMTGFGVYSASYVFTPVQGKRWQPFLLAGGGALIFSVGNTYIDTIQQNLGLQSSAAMAFLYGAGTDYRLWRIFGLRLQYRGFLYRNPDYGVPSRFFTGTRAHIAEPSLGVVVKF